MTKEERFTIEMDVFKQWLQKFNEREKLHILCVVHDDIESQRMIDQCLGKDYVN